MDKKALWKLSYGVYIVASRKDDKLNGQIANSVFQVTAEPPKIAACIHKENFTHECIKDSGVFSVSVLSKNTTLRFIGRFGFRSGRDYDKFEGVNYKIGITGAPIVLDYTVAYLEAKVVMEVSVGTHTLFVGEVVNSEIVSEEDVMTYEYYHKVKRGTTAKKATTYIKEVK